MKPPTHRLGKATVGLVAVLVIAAGITVGMAVATTGPGDDPTDVSTVDQLQQVDENGPDDESPPPDGAGPPDDVPRASGDITRSSEMSTYTTPAGEGFQVENLTIEAGEEDEMVMVSAELTNPNDWPAVQDVELRIDGELVDHQLFALNPNETDVVSFSVDTAEWEEGDHHVAIQSYHHGEVVTVSAEEPVEEPETANVTFEDQESDGTVVTVEEVTVSEGGFVAFHDTAALQEGDAIGSVIGVSDYLEAGTHENVSVTLFEVPGADFEEAALESDTNLTAMPHLDTNENETYDFVSQAGAEDGPYTVDGAAVVDSAMVTVTTESPGNETTTEPPVNETTTVEPVNGTTTEGPTNETTTVEPVNETTEAEA